jgi:hypothetical protein
MNESFRRAGKEPFRAKGAFPGQLDLPLAPRQVAADDFVIRNACPRQTDRGELLP